MSPSFVLYYRIKLVPPYYSILTFMNHHFRQGELQFHLCRWAEMPSHMSFEDVLLTFNIPLIFKLTTAPFVLFYHFKEVFTVFQDLNNYEVS